MLKRIILATITIFLPEIMLASDNTAPLLRVGFVTDTHVYLKPQSANLVKAAYELFKLQKVDAVVNCGDIADRHHPTAYKHYRDAVSSVYGNEKLPVEFFAYANHDIGRDKKISRKQYFEMLKRDLKIFHDPESVTEW